MKAQFGDMTITGDPEEIAGLITSLKVPRTTESAPKPEAIHKKRKHRRRSAKAFFRKVLRTTARHYMLPRIFRGDDVKDVLGSTTNTLYHSKARPPWITKKMIRKRLGMNLRVGLRKSHWKARVEQGTYTGGPLE